MIINNSDTGQSVLLWSLGACVPGNWAMSVRIFVERSIRLVVELLNNRSTSYRVTNQCSLFQWR